MKKIIWAYIGILVGLYLVLSFMDRNSSFAIEQKLWSVHRDYSKIAKDPSVVPENEFNNVIKRYEAVIEKYGNSSITQGVRLLVGEVYAMKNDFEKARTKFRETSDMYPDQDEFTAEAIVRIAQTFEREQNWPEAQKVYEEILDKYPITRVGIGIPIYIASYYRNENDFQNTMKYYDKAVKHYQSLVDQNPESPVEFASLRYLANCYLDQSRWKEAVDTLGEVLIKYPKREYLNAQRADITVKTINLVAAYQLKDFDVAINIYENFKTAHPKHPLNEYLQQMIDAFNELKKRNIKFNTQEENG